MHTCQLGIGSPPPVLLTEWLSFNMFKQSSKQDSAKIFMMFTEPSKTVLFSRNKIVWSLFFAIEVAAVDFEPSFDFIDRARTLKLRKIGPS